MPHFRVLTNVPQEKIPTDLSQKLCQVLATSTGKPLSYCAASVIGGVNLSFGGTDAPAVQATLVRIKADILNTRNVMFLSLVGHTDFDLNKKLSKDLFEVIKKELAVPADRMYIHFMNVSRSDVGFKGTTFHDIKEYHA